MLQNLFYEKTHKTPHPHFYFFTFYFAEAQRIHFCDSTNRWVTKGIFHPTGEIVTSTYYYPSGLGQWMSDGYYYMLLIDYGSYGTSTFSGGGGYVREDTIAGIVYYFYPPLGYSCILYNYHLVQGDTVHYTSPSLSMTNPIIDSVISVDSVLIGSLYYKRITLLEIDTDWYYFHVSVRENRLYTYIEGIGSLSKPTAFMEYGFDEILKCFSTDSTEPVMDIGYPYPYATPFPTFTDTVRFTNDCASMVIPPLVSVPENIRLIPNPAKDVVYINGFNATATYTLCNMIGTTILQGTLTNNSIDVSKLASGVYVLELSGESGERVVRRVIKQ